MERQRPTLGVVELYHQLRTARDRADVEAIFVRLLDYGVIVLAAFLLQLLAGKLLEFAVGLDVPVHFLVLSELAVGVLLLGLMVGAFVMDATRPRQST